VLHATTPSFVTCPNNPSPVPRISGWTTSGGYQAYSRTRASSSSFATALPVGLTSLPLTS